MRDPRPDRGDRLRMSPEVSSGLAWFGYKVLRDSHLVETSTPPASASAR